MNLELKGKVALVTAASKGIGAAVSRRLAAEGATVVRSARSAPADGNRALDTGEAGGSLHWMASDLSDASATSRLVDDVVAARGRLDVLVLNTPGPKITSFLDASDADWAAAFDVLVRPCVQLARAAARQMQRQGGGSIVFITSTWVKQPAAGGVLSASLRSTLSALSKAMAAELAPHGVRVNQIMPGATGTDRMHAIVAAKSAKGGTTAEQEIAQVVAQIPLGRWAEPEEIADAIAFLSSPRSGFTTGATLQIDGGAIRSTL